TSSKPRRDSVPGPSPRQTSREAGCCTAGSREPARQWDRIRYALAGGRATVRGQDEYGLPPGGAHAAPGAHVPRLVRMRERLRGAANDDPHGDAPAYAELHCLSDFTFLRGAASAEELFERAARCGYEALAITDECSLAGIVRARDAAEVTG